jgi:serpin B
MRHLAAALSLLLFACGADLPDGGDVVRSSLERDLAPAASAADLAELTAGNRAFAYDLYDAVHGQPGNLFFSPHSISIALAMTYAGARASTEAEMAATLHYTLPQDRLHPAFDSLDLTLAARGEEAASADGGKFQLSIVNAIWGQRGYPFLPAFLDTLAVSYGAGLRLLDFENAAEEARVTINDWVAAMTHDRIEDLIPEGAIDDLTRLVLTNCVYFNAAWKIPFEEEATADGSFAAPGGAVTVPMMRGEVAERYADLDGLQAIEIPYDDERLSMVILLPDPGSLAAVEADLGARAEEALAALAVQPVDLILPRFETTQGLSLAATLAAMGMPTAFSAAADFSGMNGTGGLMITDVIHKAFVKVNEAGTEAAAATAVIVGDTSAPPPAITVTVDRPFIFLIRDVPTGAILFLGRIVDPS